MVETMRLITTNDGSTSLYNPKINEGYHSSSGAITESIEKFAVPLKPFIKKKKIKVLDTCFGIGYRSAAFAYVFSDHDVEITAVEIDPSLLRIMSVVELPEKIKPFYKRFQSLSENNLSFKSDNLSCNLILGDCLSIIPKLKGKFDVILHDPFSPRKVPDLWSFDFLKVLSERLNNNGIISTYSSAKSFRDSLRDLNFKIINGPSIGRRKPSTIALKNN